MRNEKPGISNYYLYDLSAGSDRNTVWISTRVRNRVSLRYPVSLVAITVNRTVLEALSTASYHEGIYREVAKS
ncbi:MAG: hypothetical protein SAK29_11485 [Scytonema sp. PMC 1069.18]|nr:hypothetical protein [Scytonema sp. PMC 1069.18]MEC4881955.1 hypothetical protein [Scytonema sp. PMC 1070.18]